MVESRRNILDTVVGFCPVEGTRLVWDRRGRIGVAAPVESKMAKHAVDWAGARRSVGWLGRAGLR